MKISHKKKALEKRFRSTTWIPGCSQNRGMDPRICMKAETWSSRKITCSKKEKKTTTRSSLILNLFFSPKITFLKMKNYLKPNKYLLNAMFKSIH